MIFGFLMVCSGFLLVQRDASVFVNLQHALVTFSTCTFPIGVPPRSARWSQTKALTSEAIKVNARAAGKSLPYAPAEMNMVFMYGFCWQRLALVLCLTFDPLVCAGGFVIAFCLLGDADHIPVDNGLL